MKKIIATETFRNWLKDLKDKKGQAIITKRVQRMAKGNFGDAKWFDGIGELRIKFGPGYRVYFTERDGEVVILLCGGDKGTQKRDIKRAIEMKQEI